MGKTIPWFFRVPENMDRAVQKAVQAGLYRSRSEFVRDAVREKLEKMRIDPQGDTFPGCLGYYGAPIPPNGPCRDCAYSKACQRSAREGLR
jgi:hypothetical protein